MIPARYWQSVFVGLMTLFMSLAVSGGMTLWNRYSLRMSQSLALPFAVTGPWRSWQAWSGYSY